MSEPLILKGIVLEAHPYGEADKRLVILTGERGRITAFVRGARRPKSQYAAATEPFVYGEFEVYPGKNAYTLTGVNVKEYFREISSDFDNAALGFYLLELVNYYAVEENDERQMFNLLYMGIKAILSPDIDNRLIRRIFEFRAMVAFGEYPDMFAERKAPFDSLSDSALNVMRHIQTAGLKELFAITVDDEILGEISNAIGRYLDAHRHHIFKSLELVDI